MPTYEYECKECKYHFEIFQSMKDDALKTCEKCGKDSLKRLIGTGAGIIFKGSGFYETDYRSESYNKDKKKAETSSSTSKSSDKKETKKTDSGKKTSDNLKKSA